MSDNWADGFDFPDLPEGERLTADEAEKTLLKILQQREFELERTLWQLVLLYSVTGHQDAAMTYLQRLIAGTEEPEKKAAFFLTMGQLMEQKEDFESAIKFYTKAFCLEPITTEVWYLIHNNLGYCLNHFRRYKEGEPYCRAAIRINPHRHNAYKNLAISLQGQGQFTDAARNYVEAVTRFPADPRALRHLEDLMAQQREAVLRDIPDIGEQLEKCRRSVREAEEKWKRRMKDL